MLKVILAIFMMGSVSNAAYLKLSDAVGGKTYTRLSTSPKANDNKTTYFRVYGVDCNFKADGPGNSTVTVSCDGGQAIMGTVLDCDETFVLRTKENSTTVKLVCEE